MDIEKLQKLEEHEGLRLGTKLTPRHINFYNEKQKVKLAVQVFSQSVSDALKYCSHKGIPFRNDVSNV